MKKKLNNRFAVQITLLIFGVVMMTFGILRGELSEIFQKAIVVCLECIGLG